MHLDFRNWRDWSELYNYVEVALWPLIGVVLFVHGLRRAGAVRRDCFIAAAVLVAFGASDWFEANTGNEWWHPWWLFLWKAASVLILLVLLLIAWRRTRRLRASDSAPTPPPPGDSAP